MKGELLMNLKPSEIILITNKAQELGYSFEVTKVPACGNAFGEMYRIKIFDNPEEEK